MTIQVAKPSQVGTLAAWYLANPNLMTVIGGKVSQWNDISGNNKHLVQASASLRPALVADDGDGRCSVVFDGVDDYLSAALGADVLGGDFTIVMNYMGMRDDEVISFVDANPATSVYVLYRQAFADFEFQPAAGGGAAVGRGSPSLPGLGQWTQVGLRKNGTNLKIRIFPDTTDSSSATPAAVVHGALLFAGVFVYTGGPAGNSNAHLRELAVWRSYLSDADLLAALAYMSEPNGKVGPTISFPGGGTIAAADAVPIDITATVDRGLYSVHPVVVTVTTPIVLPDGTYLEEVAYDPLTGFWPNYTTGSSVSQTGPLFELVLARNEGWQSVSGGQFTLRVIANDALGAEGFVAQPFALTDPDETPPIISNQSPATGSTVGATAAVAFRIADAAARGQTIVLIRAVFADGTEELVGRRDAAIPWVFGASYNAASVCTDSVDHLDFSIKRDAGWPAQQVSLVILAEDSARNETVLCYPFFGPGGGGGSGDMTPPTITNIAPTPGSALSRTDPIFFDVTDDTGLRRAIICARFVDGTYEVIHDGDAFSAGYVSLSTRTPITGGFRYRVRRSAGWPSGPTIVPFGFDAAGNETA